MPEDGRPDELEGWGLRWKSALAVGAGFFLLIFVGVAGSMLLWRGFGSPPVNVRPGETFPAPRLNDRLDSDPRFSFAPPNPEEHAPDPAVRRAMAALAAQGNAAYRAQPPAPP